MNNSETEEITDEIIGEAVLALLKTNRPITTPTLLVRLRLMQATEPDRQRRKIIAAVIARNLREAYLSAEVRAFTGKENQWPLGNQRFAGARQHAVGS